MANDQWFLLLAAVLVLVLVVGMKPR